MAKYPGKPEVTLEQDHAFLVAVLTDMRAVLKRDGQLRADDRVIFQEGILNHDAKMPTLLELLDGYVKERT